MPKGVYQRGPRRPLTEEHKAKLRKPKAKESHFKGKTYKEVYGENWEHEIQKRRASKLLHHDKKGRSLRRPHHSGRCYAEFILKVYKRDDYTCQICGQRGGRLQADHFPKTFAYLVKEHQLKTMDEAYSCTELWNISNGRTLCTECHKKTPSYGKQYKYQLHEI